MGVPVPEPGRKTVTAHVVRFLESPTALQLCTICLQKIKICVQYLRKGYLCPFRRQVSSPVEPPSSSSIPSNGAADLSEGLFQNSFRGIPRSVFAGQRELGLSELQAVDRQRIRERKNVGAYKYRENLRRLHVIFEAQLLD